MIEKLFFVKPAVFSFHNPEEGGWLNAKEYKYSGMINTYSSFFRENYPYCSDSNGYWRFNRLKDVLVNAWNDKLQVLTHPGWWVPSAMSPRERISRCIEGRARKQHAMYDSFLKKVGRANVK